MAKDSNGVEEVADNIFLGEPAVFAAVVDGGVEGVGVEELFS